MIGTLANGLTFVRAFIGPCLWVLLAGFIAGSGSGGWLAWKLQDGRVARAEAAFERLQREQTQAIADAAAKNVIVTQDVLGGLTNARESITALAGDVRRLRSAVSVCASTSSMQVSGPSPAVAGAPVGGQPRPAVEVLQDLAAESAERADRNAAQLNALIEWFDGVREVPRNPR